MTAGSELGQASFREDFNCFDLVYFFLFLFLSKRTLKLQREWLESQSRAWCERLSLLLFFSHDKTSFESLSRWSPALPLPLPTRENHRCGTNGETGHKQVRDPCLRIRHPAPPQPCLPQRNGDRSRPARMPPGPVHWCQMSADPRPLASAFAGMTSPYPGPAWKQDAESPRTIAVVSKVGAAGAPGRGRYRGLCRGQLQKASMLCFSRMFSLSVFSFLSLSPGNAQPGSSPLSCRAMQLCPSFYSQTCIKIPFRPQRNKEWWG